MKFAKLVAAGSLVLISLVLAACATPPPVKPNPPKAVASFEEAASQLGSQILERVLELPLAPGASSRSVVIDPLFEAASGQQTAATAMMQSHMAQVLQDRPRDVKLLAFDSSGLAGSDYLIAATLSTAVANVPELLRLDAAIIDMQHGQVVAHIRVLALGGGVDHSPLPYFRDSPILIKDRAVDAYIRTALSPAGAQADPVYLDQLKAASLIDAATRFYNAGRFEEALQNYRLAVDLPSGQHLRAYNGLYLSYLKLGRALEAEQAFGKVVGVGIAYRELSLKLLFAPGRTEFWADPRVSGPYGMWLRQIARETATAKACLLIVGHSSATGTAEGNETLSLQRANSIKQRMARELGALKTRISTAGMGAKQNIIGTGTDDAADALDRRVEFKITDCG